ncbi:hypothetical protein ACSDBR_09820 [Acidithiobacillus ferriphilus]|uniref:hypothetical protein n=1 Tax=Acidithiobacillus TaxID=119977 RepID=UPI0021483A2E|nr:hypothetical protein [Acidithiobacillus ferrooxidans]MCR1347100.1 hypothetical protein [Acidithiobacillus ferrooxidans]MCR1356619.1 hypothetical protein [Acidithiobacillus ferrooxidans]
MSDDSSHDNTQQASVVTLSLDWPCTNPICKVITVHSRDFQITMSEKTYNALCLHRGNSHKADCWIASVIAEVDTLHNVAIEGYIRIMMRVIFNDDNVSFVR